MWGGSLEPHSMFDYCLCSAPVDCSCRQRSPIVCPQLTPTWSPALPLRCRPRGASAAQVFGDAVAHRLLLHAGAGHAAVHADVKLM